MADGSVIRHLAKLFRIERAGLAEQAAIDGNFSDVVQISGAAQSRDFARLHAHGFADGRGVAPHAQRVAVNVYVLHVDGGGESFQRVVVETVQRGHQPQIFRNTLRYGLRQRMILYGERDVRA